MKFLFSNSYPPMIDIISPNSYNDENANNQGSGVTENEARETIKK